MLSGIICLWMAMGALAAEAAREPLVFCPDNHEASAGLQLAGELESPIVVEETAGGKIVRPASSRDYFTRASVILRVTRPLPAGITELYVVVDHLDQDIGILQVTSHCEDNPLGTRASGLVGYTALGTGKPRRALFKITDREFLDPQAEGRRLSIAGVNSLRRVSIQFSIAPGEREAIAAEIPPDVQPRLRLSRPMQLVMSVGADPRFPETAGQALAAMREFCPAAQALGFNGAESYVRWNFVERSRGRFDWSLYDAVVAEARKHGLRWFPLLIVGSAYTLPDWFHDSSDNVPFVCLEHHKTNNIQSIFCENQTPYVQAFLKAFGEHYESSGALLGIRLGPSGNFGESQYPAGGNWGYRNRPEHIHIGWWAGDDHADMRFRAYLKRRYRNIEALNKAWKGQYASFDDVSCFLPQLAETPRKRKDFVDWYMDAMSDWCERWALWGRQSMPATPLYQSSGGWGFVESGTDFTDQTRSMVKVKGGIRATNETDSYAQNFQVTRMMSSAARFYGVDFGSEPAGFNSARGIASRIYNLLVNNGQHLFFYYGNLLGNDQGVKKWLELAPLLDQRSEPFVEIAALYPDTLSKLDDGVFRNLYASSFYQRVASLRPKLDFDFCSERMIKDGALKRYKVLVFLWSSTVESDVLEQIDRWVRDGGTIIYPEWDRLPLTTVEGDQAVYERWLSGETGKGHAVMIREDREPPHRYTDAVARQLMGIASLNPRTQAMLRTGKPDEVYLSALVSGKYAILNYNDHEARVTIPGLDPIRVGPFGIAVVP